MFGVSEREGKRGDTIGADAQEGGKGQSQRKKGASDNYRSSARAFRMILLVPGDLEKEGDAIDVQWHDIRSMSSPEIEDWWVV